MKGLGFRGFFRIRQKPKRLSVFDRVRLLVHKAAGGVKTEKLAGAGHSTENLRPETPALFQKGVTKSKCRGLVTCRTCNDVRRSRPSVWC